jgi:ribosomal-protein-alanine N-acetyltransferase
VSDETVARTARLQLRRIAPGDADFLLKLLNQPSWIANIGDRRVRSPDDARRYIEHRIIPAYAELGFGLYVVEPEAERMSVGRACWPS